MFALFNRFLVITALVLGLGAVSGCASRKPIDTSSTASIIAAVDKGDNVRVTTRNDVVHKFAVTKITNKALYGDKARVVYEDIQKIEVTDQAEEDEDDEEGGFWSRLF